MIYMNVSSGTVLWYLVGDLYGIGWEMGCSIYQNHSVGFLDGVWI